MVKKIAQFSFGWILSFTFLYIGIVQNVAWVYWTQVTLHLVFMVLALIGLYFIFQDADLLEKVKHLSDNQGIPFVVRYLVFASFFSTIVYLDGRMLSAVVFVQWLVGDLTRYYFNQHKQSSV